VDRSRIQAGQLRHRITILRSNLTINSLGGWKVGDDSPFAENVPASIEMLTGRELYAAQQKVSQVTHRITIRWMPGILSNMNVGWFDEREKFFQIQAVENPDGRRKKIDLLCIERADSARNV
jgi:SPP1 family predicted phage head-tail adaptor